MIHFDSNAQTAQEPHIPLMGRNATVDSRTSDTSDKPRLRAFHSHQQARSSIVLLLFHALYKEGRRRQKNEASWSTN